MKKRLKLALTILLALLAFVLIDHSFRELTQPSDLHVVLGVCELLALLVFSPMVYRFIYPKQKEVASEK